MQDEMKAALRCANQAFEAGMKAGKPEWQPIETAPKDGRWILLVGKHSRRLCPMVTARWCDADWWEAGEDGYGSYVTPTHWMPLPATPEEPK